LIYFLTPFLISSAMFASKWLAGLAMIDNGPAARSWLRALLIGFSFLGYFANATLNNTPLDQNIITRDASALIATGIFAYFAHAFYNSMFRR
jgi:hypothetical protein